MPIYEYKCRACGTVTEALVSSSRREEAIACRACGGRDLQKMLSAPAAVSVRKAGPKGRTCCGRDERCDAPPCSSGGSCRRD
jgi:putative FmdB family regulatory protein